MKIATRAFTFVGEDGTRDEVAEGERFFDPDHEIVRAHPDRFRASTRDEDLREELEFRAERIAASPQPERAHEPQSAAGRRQRDDDRFWQRMASELAPVEPNVDEDEQNLEAVERFDVATARAASDAALEGWYGRIG